MDACHYETVARILGKMFLINIILTVLIAQQVSRAADKSADKEQLKDKKIDNEIERLIKPAKSTFYAISECFSAVANIEDDKRLDAALLDCMRMGLNRLPDDKLHKLTQKGARGKLKFHSTYKSTISIPCKRIRILTALNKKHLKKDENVPERAKALMFRDICLTIRDAINTSDLYKYYLTNHRFFKGEEDFSIHRN